MIYPQNIAYFFPLYFNSETEGVGVVKQSKSTYFDITPRGGFKITQQQSLTSR